MMKQEIQEIIPKTSPCATCKACANSICKVMHSSQEILDLAKRVYTKKFQAGDVIMNDKDNQVFLGTILNGTVKCEKITENGKVQILGIMFQSDFLGRAHSHTNKFQAVALEDVELCCASPEDYKELFLRYPHFESSLFQQTLDVLDNTREWVVILGQKRAFERVASLIYLFYKRLNRRSFYIYLSREAMADFLGLTFETVSRQLSLLKKAGIIKIEGHNEYTVLDSAELQKLATI